MTGRASWSVSSGGVMIQRDGEVIAVLPYRDFGELVMALIGVMRETGPVQAAND